MFTRVGFTSPGGRSCLALFVKSDGASGITITGGIDAGCGGPGSDSLSYIKELIRSQNIMFWQQLPQICNVEYLRENKLNYDTIFKKKFKKRAPMDLSDFTYPQNFHSKSEN